MFKSSVRTSQETSCLSAAKVNRLMLLLEITTVCPWNYTKWHRHCMGEKFSISLLKQMINVITIFNYVQSPVFLCDWLERSVLLRTTCRFKAIMLSNSLKQNSPWAAKNISIMFLDFYWTHSFIIVWIRTRIRTLFYTKSIFSQPDFSFF